MKCCEQPGCHVKTRRDFEVEYTLQLLQWKKDGQIGPMPILQQPLGFMAHTEGSEINRVTTHGAGLKVRIMDNADIVVNKKSDPRTVGMVLALDSQYRHAAAKKAKQIAAA